MAFALVILAGLVALRIAWGVHAGHVRRRFIAEAHARGEKILISDYVTPPIPDDQNAAFFLLKAAAAIPNPDHVGEYKTPLSSDDLKSLQQVAAQSGQVIADVRHARELKQVDWGINFASPVYMILLPHLNKARLLALFERDLARYAHAMGDDRQAIEHVRDILFYSRCLDQSPFLVSHLVALGICGSACDCLTPMIPRLEIAPPVKSSNAPTRRQLEALLADLLNESSLLRSNTAAWRTEAMGILDIGYHPFPLGGGPPPNNPLVRLLLPIAVLDSVRDAHVYNAIASAATQPTYPQALAALPTLPIRSDGSMLYSATRLPTSAYMIGSPNSVFSTHYSTLAKMRRTAIQLAIRLYTLDHGHAPPSLEALVPAYLPHVPTDPMTAGNQPLIPPGFTPSAPSHPATAHTR